MIAFGFNRVVGSARVVTALVIALMFPRLLPAYAQPDSALSQTPATPQAQAAFARGVDLANLKHFSEARSEFKASFQMAPSHSALFAWAQAERLSGNCAEAVPLYQRFLQNAAASEHQEAARIALRRCDEAATISLPPPSPAPAPIAMPVVPPPPTPMPIVPPAPPYEGQLWPFAAAGTALVVTGAIVLLASQLETKAANDAQTYQAYRDARARSRWERIAGISLTGTGVATLGITAWVARQQTSTPPKVALSPFLGGAWGANLTGAF